MAFNLDMAIDFYGSIQMGKFHFSSINLNPDPNPRIGSGPESKGRIWIRIFLIDGSTTQQVKKLKSKKCTRDVFDKFMHDF